MCELPTGFQCITLTNLLYGCKLKESNALNKGAIFFVYLSLLTQTISAFPLKAPMPHDSPYAPDSHDLDLGVLRVRRTTPQPTFYAPGSLTRGVWLAGMLACGVYLYSVALSLGWFGRAPTLSETPFWLLPGLLGGLFGMLASGGVRLTLKEAGLELHTFWPQRSRRVFLWRDLQGVRFFEEETRSREQLYGVRFRFPAAEVTFRTADAAVWAALRERFV